MSAKAVSRMVQSLAILAALGGISALSSVPGSARASGPPAPGVLSPSQSADLAAILEHCASYCDRLSGSILDFVCAERVEETIAEIIVGRPAVSTGGSGAVYFSGPMVLAGNKARSKYLYDYQLIRTKSGEITETRVLLEENGHKVEEKDASLKTRVFMYKYVVMGPVGLLGREEQESFDFSVVKETTLKKQPVVIIQAAPKPGAGLPTGFAAPALETGSPGPSKTGAAGNVLYGKVWVRKSDAGILRIEWQPESMGNYEGIEEMARELGMKPRLSFVSEYGFEKNGIRFPSRYEIEEAYSRKWRSRSPLVRSTTEVTYDAYKFFTVETGVAIR